MLYTLADARAAVARFVENGTCNSTVIDARINEALSRILDMGDWKAQQKVIRILVKSHMFALPYNVEKIMWADVDGSPTKIFGMPYQFLSSGPRDQDVYNGTGCHRYIQDFGDHWPTMFDIPEFYEEDDEEVYYSGLPLYAYSTHVGDVGKKITIKGTKANGDYQEQELEIQRWVAGEEGRMSGEFGGDIEAGTTLFKTIDRVTKPATTGYITLYAIDTTNSYFYFMAKYTPSETLPQFRRYKMTNMSMEEDDKSCLLAHVRMRFVPLADADDILPIDSIQALKLMVMALREENAGNLQGSTNYEQKAMMTMEARENAGIQPAGTDVVFNIDFDSSLGNLYPGYII